MSVLKCYIDMDEETQVKARATLRRELRDSARVMHDDGHADAVIEQVWNALVGFQTAEEADAEAARAA